MKLLLTGAFKYSNAQLEKLNNLGCEITFILDERVALDLDASEFDAVVCNGLFLKNDISKFKNLKFIQVTSVGLDRLPLDYIDEKGIELYNARGVYSIPMAEWALTGVLSLYKHLNTFSQTQNNHQWIKDRNVRELSGDTVLIVGCGSVGTECAFRFRAMGMKVLAADIIDPLSDIYDEYYSMDNIDKALSQADVVVLTLPLTEKTKNMFNNERFDHFKDGAILVNIARGAVVNENDLISSLKVKKLGGAVLDVFETEPLNENSELWDLENVIVTPHNSFVSPKNNERLFNVIYTNIEKYMKVGK